MNNECAIDVRAACHRTSGLVSQITAESLMIFVCGGATENTWQVFRTWVYGVIHASLLMRSGCVLNKAVDITHKITL